MNESDAIGGTGGSAPTTDAQCILRRLKWRPVSERGDAVSYIVLAGASPKVMLSLAPRIQDLRFRLGRCLDSSHVV